MLTLTDDEADVGVVGAMLTLTDDEANAFFDGYVPPLNVGTRTDEPLRRFNHAMLADCTECLDLYIAIALGELKEFLVALKKALLESSASARSDAMAAAICALTAANVEASSRFEVLLMRSSAVRAAIAVVLTRGEVANLLGLLLVRAESGRILQEKAALRTLAITWGRDFVHSVARNANQQLQ
jgi:hypothetical protein